MVLVLEILMSVKNQLEPVLCPGQPPESLRRDISGFTRIHTFMVVFLSLSKNYHVCNISFTLTHQIIKASWLTCYLMNGLVVLGHSLQEFAKAVNGMSALENFSQR